jgi:hypothetical protein
MNTKVLLFSTVLVSNTFHFKNNSARYYSGQILIKLKFLQRFQKNTKITKFRENHTSGSQVVPCGQTDIMKLKVAFCNIDNAPNNT